MEGDHDKEAQTLLECATSLNKIDPSARSRVLQYLAIRVRAALEAELAPTEERIKEIEGWLSEERDRRVQKHLEEEEQRRQERAERKEAKRLRRLADLSESDEESGQRVLAGQAMHGREN